VYVRARVEPLARFGPPAACCDHPQAPPPLAVLLAVAAGPSYYVYACIRVRCWRAACGVRRAAGALLALPFLYISADQRVHDSTACGVNSELHNIL